MSPMPARLLTLVLVAQLALIALLVVDRVVPPAHASETMRCEIANWPDALRGQGFDAIRVKIDEVRSPVPVQVKDWNTSDRVRVQVDDWNTSDTVRVESR